MPEEGNKRYSSIPEPYEIHRCQRRGDCVEVEIASTGFGEEVKGFMSCVAVMQRCVGVKKMTGAVARGRELEKSKKRGEWAVKAIGSGAGTRGGVDRQGRWTRRET